MIYPRRLINYCTNLIILLTCREMQRTLTAQLIGAISALVVVVARETVVDADPRIAREICDTTGRYEHKICQLKETPGTIFEN